MFICYFDRTSMNIYMVGHLLIIFELLSDEYLWWLFVAGGKKEVKWSKMATVYKSFYLFSLSTVSVWRLSAGLPSRPRLLSSGGLLHVHPLRAPRHPRGMRVCRWAGRLRRIRYDPLLPSLWLSEERLISVQPEGLPRQTPLWASEIRWGLHLLTALEEIWFCFGVFFLSFSDGDLYFSHQVLGSPPHSGTTPSTQPSLMKNSDMETAPPKGHRTCQPPSFSPQPAFSSHPNSFSYISAAI